jgi:hypothetical protein
MMTNLCLRCGTKFYSQKELACCPYCKSYYWDRKPRPNGVNSELAKLLAKTRQP